MSSECLVKFYNNPDGVYYSGQKVSGEIQLNTIKSKNIRAIYITITGYAEVRFSEDDDTERFEQTEKHSEVYRADEQYLFVRKYVEGTPCGESFDFEPGSYTYKFEAEIPETAPTSFDGEFGQIRYEVDLVIDRAWRYNNVFKQPFTVIHPLDLNEDNAYRKLLRKMDAKNKWGGMCLGATLLIRVDIPHSGYAPGQIIPIHVFIKNFSLSNCDQVKLKLKRYVKYTSMEPKVKTKEIGFIVLQEHFKPRIKFKKKNIYPIIPLPSIPPTTVGTCKLIEVSYKIHIKALIDAFSKSLKMRIPITIGTVPIEENTANRSDATVAKNEELEHTIDTIRREPPCFKEVLHTLPYFENEYDNNNFIKNAHYLPKYPFYEETLLEPAVDSSGHSSKALVAAFAELKTGKKSKKK